MSPEEVTIIENINDNSNNDINNISSRSPKNDNYISDNKMSKELNNIIREFDLENNEKKDNSFGNKSEKILISRFLTSRKEYQKKKSHTVKLESSKILNFFKKWKNAYLQLALKK